MEKEEVKKFLESKLLVRSLYAIGVVLLAVLIFYAGVNVGFQKASFSRDWGEHYDENFGTGHRPGPLSAVDMDDFPNAHGAIGKIIKVQLPNIIVEDRDGTEKAVLLATDTSIQKGQNVIQVTELALDDFVVVIGSPDAQGVIEAKFIRVIPSPQLLNN